MHTRSLLLLAFVFDLLACSGSNSNDIGSTGQGGLDSSGGTATVGGGATGGHTSGGGIASTGGAAGGTSNAASGGAATGGINAVGGSSAATGGSSSAAGGSSTGGKSAVGGSTTTGGASNGGANTGGLATTGGKSNTGGAPSSGGVNTGGMTANGGANIGGVTASGGKSNTGGSATGGATSVAGASSVAIVPFNWVGVVGSGQSLSVGTTPASSTTQPYNNLMLSLNGATVPGTGSNPWDSTLTALKVAPLVEPLRALQTTYPSPYPGNLYGETHHAAMANEITRFVKAASASADYITVHSVVGESGQGIVALNKQTGSTTGTTGRAYAATLFEVGALNRLAQAANKSYGVGVVVMTHGETDENNAGYKDALIQLMSDYNTDIPAITGQTYKIPMYLSQQHGCPNNGICSRTGVQRPLANTVMWQLGVDHKGDFVCTGPKYQYPAHSNGDGIHLSVVGYQLLGEKTAQVYYQRAVLGQDWQPLQPTSVERSGRVVTVHFHVPVAPLNWDTTFDAPAITEWKNGKGFELRTDTANITISSVAISGDTVQITASADLPTSGLIVGYALTGQGKQLSNHSKAVRWGQLRDSDPFVGGTTKQANPNYCVSFEMPVP